MMKRFLFFTMVVWFGSCHIAFAQGLAQGQAFKHPGMLHTQKDLDFIKQKIKSGEEPWKTAWESLRNGRSSSLDFVPEPATHVIRGPYGRPSIGDRELSRSAQAAYGHALLWALTGERVHAEKSIEIINAWSNVLWDFQLNDAKLLAAWTGDDFCNAAEILRYTDSGWAKKDIEKFKRMMLTVYYPLLENFFPEANGNWDAAIINTMLCIGIFCDDQDIFNRAVNHYMYGRGNGGITKYVYPSGQCQESTRDQTHTQMGLDEFALACEVAYNQGVDLYGVANNRLALGFEYTAKYLLDEDVPAYGVVSEQGRGRLRDIYEGIYQHYHHVKGLEMPYTQRAIERTRGGRRSGSALTMHKGPLANAPSSMGAPKPGNWAPLAGAQNVPTVQPSPQAVVVALGGNIQTALDSCGVGGWVVLENGVHVLSDTLKIPSDVTLSGQGLETIVMLDPELTGPTLVNATPDLHDVTLRDLVIEGALSSETPDDPNSRRRQRAFQKAPSRAGIVFSALQANQMQNLRFEHVTVRNFTHDGVALRGAQNVNIMACDFSDNGGGVVPGPGLQHNLLITRSSTCQIQNSRFDTSIWGCGVDVSHSQDVLLENNEVARNALYGVRVTESEKIVLINNLIEGNDQSGIRFYAQMDGCRDIQIRNNMTRNNAGYGVEISRVVKGVLQNNTVLDNRLGAQVHVTSSQQIAKK